jgi:protein-S-isoprenylcysteine O-methyltransferase Ste14
LKLNIATLVVIGLALAVFAVQASRLHADAARVAGISIAFPSLLLLVVARLQLGRAFSISAKASTLVTTGLYARIRNPIYLFGGLVVLGVIIWTERPWLLLIFAAMIPVQVFRMRKEEKVLTEKFGAAYLEYKQKTWF